MDSNECPQVTVIPAEGGWELVIWQAKGDGEPNPHGGLRYLPVRGAPPPRRWRL